MAKQKQQPPTGTALIAQERLRQIADLGWTGDHDDEHVEGELATAASLYASPFLEPSRPWPWEAESDHATEKVSEPYDYAEAMKDPKARQRRIAELVKAGALCAAEIDRLERMP